ncbi:hypothetical protein L218DRAFT_330287 [Marasmius fiardii PR-910]|nr:hypothetical protein L218DRAFT_330287 [Marasmius fiardii PR-910]
MVTPEQQQHVCPTCDRVFTRKGDLTRHRRGIHGGERPYICEECYKAFAQASGLKTHRNIHTGEKPFVCDVDGCTKAFGDPSSCARHRKEIHRGIESYKCPVEGCSSCIKRRSAFACHLKKHGLKLGELNSDSRTSHKRVRIKPSAKPNRAVKMEPTFFTPQSLPAYHGAYEEPDSAYLSSIPYINHNPYHDSHLASVYLKPLPNNFYSAQSRSVTRTLELGASSSLGSNHSLCPTPEPGLTTSGDLASFRGADDVARMFMTPFSNHLWSVAGVDDIYQEPYPYIPPENRRANASRA